MFDCIDVADVLARYLGFRLGSIAKLKVLFLFVRV